MSADAAVRPVDPLDVRRARSAPGLLRAFNDAGVLAAADVHVAARLAALCGEEDELVTLAAALAVRGPRLGHVCVDLATIRDTAAVDTEETVDLATLPWPDPAAWVARLSASPLVSVGEDAGGDPGPLRLVETTLYLDRYWREEREVEADLRALSAGAAGGSPGAGAGGAGALGGDSAAPGTGVGGGGPGAGAAGGDSAALADPAVLAGGLERLFPGQTDSRQTLAAATAVLRRFAVVAGGPGTGKTTTVARIVALLLEQARAAGAAAPLIALAAPTAKAAARLEEAVHDEARTMTADPAVRDALLELGASTLHRLLGWRPGSHSRFKHDRGNRLPHDVVIVDETSMVSLSMMARIVEAIRPDARLVLVGDPGQLTSIEAGAVLGDIVGPAADGLLLGDEARTALGEATGHLVVAADPPPGASVADGIVVLDRVHRYDGGIERLAEAIRRGDAAGVIALLAAPPDGITWLPVDVADPDADAALEPVRAAAVAAARAVAVAAHAGDADTALRALTRFRILCAHRRGPHGVAAWTARIEAWLAAGIAGFGEGGAWYPGRPLLVTENDYALRLFNGDTGVVVSTGDGRVTAAFQRRGQVVDLRPSRLGAVETVHAMTVHKAQGSQFDTAAVLLPDPSSQLLRRELLYTAVTRVRERLILAGTEEAVRAAVERPVARASGLRARLWGEPSPRS